MSEASGDSHLVVIGSSAGGIGALSEVVSKLPEDFPAPVVIAQHLDPEHKSHLKEILQRYSKLPVRTIEEDVSSSLESGVIFVVPSDRHVNITDSHINLTEDSSGRPKPSVDLLLSSAAAAFDERLVAVILSGSGTDGTEGAREVRRTGGTVVVQDPETAEFGGMPGSLAPNTVDIISELANIGRVVSDLVSGDETTEGEPPPDEDGELNRFLEELRENHGLDFTSYKRPTILRRLRRRMVATDMQSVVEYTDFLRENPEEYRNLVNAFLIKVTEFFRDPELFSYLEEEVIPALIEDAEEDSHQFRIWSAGCATGEEAYSLAILLSEVLGSRMGLFNVRIFATDVDEEAVNFARGGLYPASAVSGLPEGLLEKYFDRRGSQYEVKKVIRQMIVFGEHDLARRSPFPNIDLVLSRNVLIYFTAELQRRALQLFAYSLRNGGCLVLGKAETVSPLPGFFEQAHAHHKVYHRRGERFLMPASLPVSSVPLPRVRGEHPSQTGRLSRETQREIRRARTTDEGVLNRLPVGAVMVDRRYDIQAMNTAARRMLSIHGVAVGEDLLHLLQNIPYAEVRGAIDAAFRDGGSAYVSEFVIEDVVNEEHRYLQMICQPQREEGEKGLADTVMVIITDVTDLARARRQAEEGLEEARGEFEEARRESEERLSRSHEHNERLVETNHRLEETNRELTRLNEDLQVANEESLISTEEAQAATEEVETLNEELQATNEELETLNEELQATIEELNTTNEDLHSRSAELREYARVSEEEQTRLYAVLGSLPDATVVVDASGEPSFVNPTYTRTFGEDGFLPLSLSGETLAGSDHPMARAGRGERFSIEVTARTVDDEQRRFHIEGRPTDGEVNSTGGLLIIRRLEDR